MQYILIVYAGKISNHLDAYKNVEIIKKVKQNSIMYPCSIACKKFFLCSITNTIQLIINNQLVFSGHISVYSTDIILLCF